ncbi:hypothetical protein AB3538_18230 [Acinetobacter baumannii]
MIRGEKNEKDKQVEQKNTLRRVASASFIGNFVEWFDYAAYGFWQQSLQLFFSRKVTL